MCVILLEDFKKAQAAYTQALKLGSNDKNALYRRALTYHITHEYAKALADYNTTTCFGQHLSMMARFCVLLPVAPSYIIKHCSIILPFRIIFIYGKSLQKLKIINRSSAQYSFS
jgi:tetratricopeptide (TPR) repeat protein